jgi:hypothetical protein
VFVDTHTSNGADYQHIMTLIPTQHNRLAEPLGTYLKEEMIPFLFEEMEINGFPLVPYVNAWGSTPENGWVQFKDGPRYSSGFAALFHTLSFMPEAHMLKTYEERVSSMRKLLEIFLESVEKDGDKMLALQKEAKEATSRQDELGFNHIPNREKHELIKFLGYEAGTKPSDVSGHDRLYYDREKPFEAQVKYYNTYEPSLHIQKPKAYIIPQGWHNIIERLIHNGVALKEAVDAWAQAPSSETAIAFQNAELVRWMEWGANSFFRLLQGATVLLFGLAMARSGSVPHVLGWFAMGAGLAYIAVGVIVGYDGFSGPSLNIGVTADALLFVAAAWIVSVGWRKRGQRT